MRFFCIARLVVYSKMEPSLDDRTVWIGNIPDFMDEVAVANYIRGLGLPQALSIQMRPGPKNEQYGLFQYASKKVAMEILDSKIVWGNDRNALIRPSHFKPDARISPARLLPVRLPLTRLSPARLSPALLFYEGGRGEGGRETRTLRPFETLQ